MKVPAPRILSAWARTHSSASSSRSEVRCPRPVGEPPSAVERGCSEALKLRACDARPRRPRGRLDALLAERSRNGSERLRDPHAEALADLPARQDCRASRWCPLRSCRGPRAARSSAASTRGSRDPCRPRPRLGLPRRPFAGRYTAVSRWRFSCSAACSCSVSQRTSCGVRGSRSRSGHEAAVMSFRLRVAIGGVLPRGCGGRDVAGH